MCACHTKTKDTHVPHLFVTDVLGGERDRPLHGDEGEDLEEVVLHDVADDADRVKVAAAALGAKVLLERDHHTGVNGGSAWA